MKSQGWVRRSASLDGLYLPGLKDEFGKTERHYGGGGGVKFSLNRDAGVDCG